MNNPPYMYNAQSHDAIYNPNHFERNFAESTTREQNWVPNVCRFFLNGNCRYGEFCRNSHIIQNEAATSIQPIIRPHQAVRTVTTTTTTTTTTTNNHNNINTCTDGTRNWIDAPEFVPRYISQNNYDTTQVTDDDQGASSHDTTVSYARIVSGNSYDENGTEMFHDDGQHLPPEFMASTLCPYIQTTINRSDGTISCKYGDRCPYQHGDLCDICGAFCLHPTDQNQRKNHEKECMKLMEKDMEHSFAVARSKDKTCGICFEVITEKTNRSEHRFGILPNCNHIFCLSCIRKWRQAKNFDSTITRACPECRVESHYVCPSLYWVDNKDEKEKLLNEYKEATGKQPCKYFNRGEGTCPFGNKCFYKHALPNGELVDVGIPQPRRRFDLHGDSNLVESVILWNFLQARNNFDTSDDDDTFSSYTDPSDSN